MRKIRLKIEYDGSSYFGWQVQAEGPTIQGVIEERLRTMTREKSVIIGAGRTDSGVHAWGQVAHFVTKTGIPTVAFFILCRLLDVARTDTRQDGYGDKNREI